MADAKRDANGVPIASGVSNADGQTILPIKVDPSDNSIKIDDNTTGTVSTRPLDYRDNNQVPILMGVSSEDGVTLVPICIDSATGNLLINSN